MSGARPRLELVVDEVVLRGVPPEQAHAAVAALEARLAALGEGWARSDARLSARDEAFRRWASVAVPAASPAALGEAVGDAVWDSIAGRVRP